MYLFKNRDSMDLNPARLNNTKLKFLYPLLEKLNRGDSRSVNAKKNIFNSFLIKGGSILISLALVPLTIDFINPQQYGIWLTLYSIIAWFNFFDIGFGNGLKNKFAEAVANNDKELARTYVSTTYAMVTLLIAGVWILSFAVIPYLDWSSILNVDSSMREELKNVMYIIISFFSMQFILKLIGTILTANQQIAKSNMFNLLADILSLSLIFGLKSLHVDGMLKILALITGSTYTVVLLVASFWFFTHELKEYVPHFRYVRFKYLPTLMSLGIKFFIIQVSMIFVFQSTNIIITQILGPEQVTTYNVLYRYFSIPVMVVTIICAPLWAACTEAYTKQDFRWMENVHRKLSKIWLYSILVLLVLLVGSQLAFKIWLGDKVHINFVYSILMMINIIALTRSSLYLSIINGIGKIKLQLITIVILSLLFIPLALVFGKKFGLPGIIFCNILVNLAFAVITPIQSRKIISQRASGIWDK